MFSKGNKKVIKIDGMHCEHCVKKVTEVLARLEGVTGVKVNLNKKEAVIKYSKEIDNQEIIKVIDDINFKVTDII